MSTALTHINIKDVNTGSGFSSSFAQLNSHVTGCWIVRVLSVVFIHNYIQFLVHFRSSLRLFFWGQLNTRLTTRRTQRLTHVTIPTKMRQYLIASRIHLMLSVINFALAAPLVMRGRHEVRVDMVDVAKDGDGTTASQTLSQRGPRDGRFPAWWSSEEWDDPFLGPELPDESDSEPEPNDSGSETGSSHNSPPGSPHDGIAEGNHLLLLANAAADAYPSSPDLSSPHQTPTVSPSSTNPGLAILQWAADDPSRSAWYETLKAPPSPILSSTDSDYFYPLDSNSHSTGSGSTGSDYPYSTGSWSTVSNYYSKGSGSTGSDYSYYSMDMGPTGTGHSYSTGSGSSHDPPPSDSWDQMPTDDSTGSLSTKQSTPQSPVQIDNHPPPGPPPNPAPLTGPQQSTDGPTQASLERQSPAEPEPEPEPGTFPGRLLKGKIRRHT